MANPTDPALRTRNIIVGVVVIAIVGLLVILWNREVLFGRTGGVADSVPRVEPAVSSIPVPNEAPAAVPGASPPDSPERRWAALMGGPPVWPDDLSNPGDCDDVDRDVRLLCRALDDRADLRVAAAGNPCDFLREALGDLAARPPAASGELRSYPAILSNVFHLFRVLGAKRIAMLRSLLADKPELAEPAALTLYRWWISRETCGTDETGSVDLDSLYDYASFALNTMGGQAYLRRRSPSVEALTCFYALQALDAAIDRGHNPNGIDPQPELARCRALVATQPLVFSESYALALDAMAGKWEGKGRSR